ncbi:MAG: thiamine diphosphokinase [Clostridiales bacterium]|nr:thiamine diphosphokinase [Clostridiales bacterium]
MKIKQGRTLIISGSKVSTSFLREYLSKEAFDYIIAADYGLLTAHKLELALNYILGDFDSVPQEIINEYKEKNKDDKSFIIKKYNPEKDFTDTQIAIETAMELGSKEIVIVGGTGTRLDHTLSNVQNLLLPLRKNIKSSLVDEHNKLYIIDKSTKIYKKDIYGSYVSLLPITPVVEKVTLKGFKYPLNDYNIEMGHSIGVSNELIDDFGEIVFESGLLLVVEARD